MSVCPNCGKNLDDSNLLRCPHCQIDVPTFIRVNLENLKASQDYLTSYKARIDSEVERKVKAQVFRFAGAIGGLCLLVVSLLFVSSRGITKAVVATTLQERLREPQMKKALNTAANASAGEMLRQHLLLPLQRTQQEAENQFAAFRSYLDSSKAAIGEEYKALTAQVALVKERNRLAQLANSAIAEGSCGALEELRGVGRNPERQDLTEVAQAEVARVKAFYATSERFKEEIVTYQSPEGIPLVDDKIPTATLLAELERHTDWRVRAKFAQLLGFRREDGVAEALIEASKRDRHLAVVMTCIQSFEMLTGYRAEDLLDAAAAEAWWRKKGNNRNPKE